MEITQTYADVDSMGTVVDEPVVEKKRVFIGKVGSHWSFIELAENFRFQLCFVRTSIACCLRTKKASFLEWESVHMIKLAFRLWRAVFLILAGRILYHQWGREGPGSARENEQQPCVCLSKVLNFMLGKSTRTL